MMASTQAKVEKVCALLREMKSVLVAFSGGIDSTLVAYLAARELGDHAVVATAVSPSLADEDREEAVAIGKRYEWQHILVEPREFQNPRYIENAPDRCFWCKHALAEILGEVAMHRKLAFIVDGSNIDDCKDYRPGRKASEAAGVRSPLIEAQMTKVDIREAARMFDLPNRDKPAKACLSSRIPYGTPIEIETLRKVDAAERALRSLGFEQVRVRDHGAVARIEILPPEFEKVLKSRDKIVATVKSVGYTFVALDLAGYRSGSLNEIIGQGTNAR